MINRNQFKIILLIFMVVDHIGILLPSEIAGWCHIVSRFVAVGFAYLAVEGFKYTKDLKMYIIRLYLAAGIMQIGNFILNPILQTRNVFVVNNIFLTLALGITALACIKHIRNTILKIISSAIIITIAFLFAEGGVVIVPFMILTYIFREKRKIQILSYLILGIALFLMVFSDDSGMSLKDNLIVNNDFLFVTIIPFIFLYDHKKCDSSKLNKYFFYIFYPLHLWLIAFTKFLLF
ncbi:TraX family protein [Streptococcus agalactiae]|uniref:TraX family protein n=1 Tax=Streptococcus agalactiae TaxID=1311 RepID=UPI000A34A726|nr:TraX family protein [Streptococcus agalactiae]OTG44332.1 hypothetical protein B7936_07225 [Streptococcus agalactiae]OTG47872.1 hypothetical protein B7935_03565 [Streptococcus agalactiae]OTG50704.1 hypothetical protein B7932_07725 [Streptococcus agalactiae]OTG55594.1 hypothetical protein B7930_08495 [Streptococcus agalactiae]RRA75882.1 hypothetical protein D5F81_08085 [Streptococcus agalactiae]